MRALDSLDDTELDCPNARQALAEMMEEGRQDGWLDKSLQAVPTTNSEASTGLSTQHVPAFKNKVAVVLREYFDSFDRAEVKRSLEELEEPGLMHLFVKKAVTMALDGKHKDREAVSLLLADLRPEVIKEEQMKMGFSKLLASAEDLALDVPEVGATFLSFHLIPLLGCSYGQILWRGGKSERNEAKEVEGGSRLFTGPGQA